MTIIILLQILLIIIAVTTIFMKNNLKSVIFLSVFSLISASLYFLYRAPDLALAEAAIGSAIIPLLFIITISKQRQFIVVTMLKEDDFLNKDSNREGYNILNELTNFYNLELVILKDKIDTNFNIFRLRNVDLFVYKIDENYIFKGNRSSAIMHKLDRMCDNYSHVNVVYLEKEESYD